MTAANNSRDNNLSLLQKAVHSDLEYERYMATHVKDYTNCYSHAIGSNLPFIELYRVGAICGKKPLDQEYFSTGEVESLLFEDLKVLELQIEKSYLEEVMKENQYQILLYVKIYADHKIHDFHFVRHDQFGWSEKWRYRQLSMLDDPINYYDDFPWQLVGVYKITK